MTKGVLEARPDRDEPGLSPVRVTLLYALFGCGWIAATSWWLARGTVEIAALARFELVKGLFFIAVSSLFLYGVLRLESRRRVRSEQEARERGALLDLVLQNAAEGIVLVSPEGKILYANSAVTEIAGVARDVRAGERYEPDRFEVSGLDGEPIGPAELPVARTLRSGEPVRNADLVYRRGPDDERVLSVNAAPVLDEEGNVVAAVSCFRDRTEVHRAEEALRQREEQLQRSRRMEAIGRLAGGVAHDFNNLLTAMLGYVTLAREGAARGEPVEDELEEIRRAAEQAADLTGQLLAFSRQQVRKPRPVDPSRVLESVTKMLDRMIGETVRLDVRLDPRRVSVLADPGQLEQIVMNLVVNARDAMPRGGSVILATGSETLTEPTERQGVPVPAGEYFRLVVEDEGEGIAPDHLPHVFEPFYTTKGPGEGTGLGLSTVYGVVKQNGGFVWVESELERGTRFEVFLPLTDAPALPSGGAAAAERTDEPTEGSVTILLVEDEDAVRRLLRRTLSSRGYRVLEAASGEAGLAILREMSAPPDLLLTDVVMPGLDGRALAEKARERFPGLPVLFVSGYSEQVVSRFGRVEDGIDLLEKPFEPGVLFEKVRSLVGRGTPPDAS